MTATTAALAAAPPPIEAAPPAEAVPADVADHARGGQAGAARRAHRAGPCATPQGCRRRAGSTQPWPAGAVTAGPPAADEAESSGAPGPGPDLPPVSGPPGARTFSIEGRAAPGLYVSGWFLGLVGALLIVLAVFDASGAAAVVFAGAGLVALVVAFSAACGYQLVGAVEPAGGGLPRPGAPAAAGVRAGPLHAGRAVRRADRRGRRTPHADLPAGRAHPGRRVPHRRAPRSPCVAAP